jgi:hypothetical protein
MNNTSLPDDLSKLYLDTGSCLNDQILHMTSYEYEQSLESKSKDEKEQSAIQFFNLKDRRDKWLNAILQEIIQNLDQNKSKLQDAINQVNKAKQFIDNITQYLQAVADLIGIVTQIMKLAGVV